MTPPALAMMSGTRKMPRSCRIGSASGATAALAPSVMSLARMRPALCSVITSCTAAGTSTVTGSSSSSSFVTASAFLNPLTPPRRLHAALRPADVDGLPGHRGRHGVTLVHGDRVHDPGHDLGVRAHVGRGDVLLRADQDRDLGCVPARQVLELVLRKPVRVDG